MIRVPGSSTWIPTPRRSATPCGCSRGKKPRLTVQVVQGDFGDPDTVLADPGVNSQIDMSRPVAVLMAAVLHFMPPDEAGELAARWMARTAAGSWLLVSTARYDSTPLEERMQALYTTAQWLNYTREDIAAVFAAAGVIPQRGDPRDTRNWPMAPPLGWSPAYMLGGFGRKR